MAVNQTKSGNWYVQYRIPGISSPRKEYSVKLKKRGIRP